MAPNQTSILRRSKMASRCISRGPYTEARGPQKSSHHQIHNFWSPWMQRSVRLIAALLALSCMAPATRSHGEDDKTKSEAKADAKTAEKPPLTEVTTQGSVDVGGQHILYNAIAGIITVGATDPQDAQLGFDGKALPGSQLEMDAPKEPKDAPPTARMSYFAYFKKDAKAEDRPITFFYNGGPGSSTVWLHMGSLGPKHVVTDTDQHLPAAPYKLTDNPQSLLDASDLVFIDRSEERRVGN